VNIALLEELARAGGAFLPWPDRGEEAEARRRDLDDLAAFGHRLAIDPIRGAAWLGPADRLCPEQIAWGLEPIRVGRRFEVFDVVGSTNDLAAEREPDDEADRDGLVVMAEEQTAGRGRRGRPWMAPRGSSLLMSIRLDPPPALAGPAWLTAWGAVAVAELVAGIVAGPVTIKWPNDVRVGGRKVAGVLAERGRAVVVGIGLNVHAPTAGWPAELRPIATAMSDWTDRPLDRSALARSFIAGLDALYDEGQGRGPGPLGERWSARLEAIGRRVIVATAGGRFPGVLSEADLSRGLVVVGDDGVSRRVPTLEVAGIEVGTNGGNPGLSID